ncbi:hypothetical protein J2792_003013 [Novosphingobium capsulatum]|uniref:Uncharacterized protein n=1 Tax=Novosphingobium capsulatum TaxID=13688 RepID=A0ABU1MP57_9SPHN|nr:hypothetical protein [Novosphingobium capsulatum]
MCDGNRRGWIGVSVVSTSMHSTDWHSTGWAHASADDALASRAKAPNGRKLAYIVALNMALWGAMLVAAWLVAHG